MNNKTCMCVSLRKVTNHISKLYDRDLSALDIKITQYSVLRNINDLGNPTIDLLSSELSLERTTVLRSLDKLKKIGLISYKKNNIDKMKVIYLTANGIKILDEAGIIWEKTQKKFLNALELNKQNKFDSFMNRISRLNF